jgi:NAD(P)-dependent dehydrogenase (short-subunit alcohol dehydrogenase family)
VVTGAARGIGRRVALTLAERGFTVAANDLDTPRGRSRSWSEPAPTPYPFAATSRTREPSAG